MWEGFLGSGSPEYPATGDKPQEKRSSIPSSTSGRPLDGGCATAKGEFGEGAGLRTIELGIGYDLYTRKRRRSNKQNFEDLDGKSVGVLSKNQFLRYHHVSLNKQRECPTPDSRRPGNAGAFSKSGISPHVPEMWVARLVPSCACGRP